MYLHLHLHYITIYIYTVHYVYVQQLSPPHFLPFHVMSSKKIPLRNFLPIQADGVSGVIHSATRLALQLFLNSERAGKIDKDGGRAGELCSGGLGELNHITHPPKKWKKGGGGGGFKSGGCVFSII